ncbi:MAG TPA: FAD-dependent oxidoreductase [Anaerolineae bacterium]|jgi:thioredoxin reductase|nr:FAD-dependent oxidoreductase [Anaerolineae bacterium]
MYDLIIIGGGPAGLTATIYALRKRLNVLLISKDLGGKTNFRLQLPEVEHHLVINGEEVVSRFVNEIRYLDFSRIMDKVEKIEKIDRGYRVFTRGGKEHERPLGEYDTRSIIIASGTQGQFLNVPGEKDYLMRGLCFSAMSYAPLFIERDTVVVGDDDLAMRAAMELAQICKSVTLIAPTHGKLDSPIGKRLQTWPNVLILEGYQAKQVKGDSYARSLVIGKNGDTRELKADAIFVELGLKPNSEMVKGLVDLEADGRIRIDAQNRTSAPGIFAAGDVTNAYAEQVLIAIGEGAKAALAVHEYLMEQPIEQKAMAELWR